MTRIIAGAAGSIPLRVPPHGTRPTSDRVRESLFAALETADAVRGMRVLDLFAGSGALGLEALSRGAARVDLVEKAPRAADVAAANARAVLRATPGGTAVVHRAAVDTWLAHAAGGPDDRYDTVLLDPPYDVDEEALRVTLALVAGVLAPDGLVVVERASRSPEPAAPAAWERERSKRYGDTAVWWFRAPGAPPERPAPGDTNA